MATVMSAEDYTYTVGSLVHARERDSVVQPSEDPELLRLWPLSGSEHEACGIYLPLEGNTPWAAEFRLPNPYKAGDFIAGRLLRDAARLSVCSGAGAFRSLGYISVRPRPYEFVPLIRTGFWMSGSSPTTSPNIAS
jgi:hypothetical protein